MVTWRPFLTALWALLIGVASAKPTVISQQSTQVVVAIAPHWDSSHATLQRYDRQENGDWQAIGESIAVRLGREGLAWGLGLHPPQQGKQKQEGDWRAPAGIFGFQNAYGDAKTGPQDMTWPYEQVTEHDLWVEDSQSPLYNQHVELAPDHVPSDWETGQRMKLGDPAHRLKLAVAHNAAPNAVPGAGSAIFVHIWRKNGDRPTSGCTAMAAENLENMLRWLDPQAMPLFVLLPQSIYGEVHAQWGLPAPIQTTQPSPSE